MGCKGDFRENLIINRDFSDINPLLCGYQHCVPEQSFGPAMREYYLLYYVFSGAGEYHTGGRIYKIKPGQMFVVKPHEQVFYKADINKPWCYSWIGFETNLDIGYLLGQPVIDLPRAESVFQHMYKCESMHISKEFAITGKLFELFALLSEQQIAPAESMPSYILKAINYIEANYVMPLSVARLAADLNLDRSYFSTAFKRATNKSPQEYVVDYRLEKAAELMVKHGCRPGEAGQSVGYRDIFNFSRMFKRRYGVSPTEYIEGLTERIKE